MSMLTKVIRRFIALSPLLMAVGYIGWQHVRSTEWGENSQSQGLHVGSPLPLISLVDDAVGTSKTSIPVMGRRLIVLFVHPDCVHCHRLTSALAQRSGAGARYSLLRVVSISDVASGSRFHALEPRIRVLYDPDLHSVKQWGITRTPTIVFVDEGGVVERIEVGWPDNRPLDDLLEPDVPTVGRIFRHFDQDNHSHAFRSAHVLGRRR